MDKVLDKLGIYDLIGVLLPGVIATAVMLILDQLVFNIGLKEYLNADSTVQFLVISYFLGMVLQEIGSITMKYFDKGHKLLEWSLKTAENRSDSISKQEWELIESTVSSAFPVGTKVEKTLIYDYCKNLGGNTANTDKDQSIAAMSRSLAVYFTLVALGMLIYAVVTVEVEVLVWVAISLLLTMLLWYRSIRFYKIRYIRIVRNYFFHHLKNEKM